MVAFRKGLVAEAEVFDGFRPKKEKKGGVEAIRDRRLSFFRSLLSCHFRSCIRAEPRGKARVRRVR